MWFKKDNKEIDYRSVNDVLSLTKKILSVLLVLLVILISWVTLMIIGELEIKSIILTVLGILSPLFIGLIVAWLLNPFVSWMTRKKIKRPLAVAFAYALMLGIFALLIGTIIPVLYEQILDFADTLPSLFKTIEEWMTGFFNNMNNKLPFDLVAVKENAFNQVEEIGNSLYSSLPETILSVGKTLVSGFSTFLIGLVIGFFLLLSFDNMEETYIYIFPKNWRKDVEHLLGKINASLKNYVLGVAIDAFVVFLICTATFSIVGLRAPLLFAAFCAITNVIPYVGPYIGAIPAVIVGFTMSPTIGLLTVASIVVIQFVEGNFLQEYIMSKTTKLHPVTIIIGLLVFQHFWGIIGMVFSTPILAILKIIFNFIDHKLKIIDYDIDDEDEKEEVEVLENA